MGINGAPTNPHYGFYAFCGAGISTRIIDIAAQEGWAGFAVQYSWKELETAEGVYDFSRIEEAMDLARSYNIQLFISLLVQGSRAEWTECPAYIRQDAKYGECNNDMLGHWTRSNADRSFPITWNQNIIDRIIALGQALGAEYNDDPNWEGMDFWETSLSDPVPNDPVTCAYSHEARRLGEQQILTGVKAAFPDKFVTYRINWCPWGCDLSYDFCLENGITVANADTWLDEPPVTDTYPWQKQHRSQINTMGLISNPSFTGADGINGGTATPEALLRYNWTDIDPWYLLIVGYSEPYFSEGGQALADLYPDKPPPVLSCVEAVRLLRNEGWDLGHGATPTLPTVSVQVDGSPIREDSVDVATFTLNCPSCSSEQIHFTVGGDAVEGVHYTIDKTSPQPAGTLITINPINTQAHGNNVHVSLTLTPDSAYTIGTGSGSVEIVNVMGPVNPPTEVKMTVDGKINVILSGAIEVK